MAGHGGRRAASAPRVARRSEAALPRSGPRHRAPRHRTGVVGLGRVLGGRLRALLLRPVPRTVVGRLPARLPDPITVHEAAGWRRGALPTPEGRRGGAPVATVLEDGVDREGTVASGSGCRGGLERRARAEHDEQARMVAEGGADALVLARPAQVGRAAPSRDDRPAAAHEQVLDAPFRVGQRVVAVAGPIARGCAARARGTGRGGRHRVEQARQLVECLALRLADRGDGVEATRGEHPGPPGRVDGPRGRRDDRVAALAPGLDEHLDPVPRLRRDLLGRRGPCREHGVGPRREHVQQPVDATGRRPLLVAGADALDEGAEPSRDGGVDEGLEQARGDRTALELE